MIQTLSISKPKGGERGKEISNATSTRTATPPKGKEECKGWSKKNLIENGCT